MIWDKGSKKLITISKDSFAQNAKNDDESSESSEGAVEENYEDINYAAMKLRKKVTKYRNKEQK